MARTKQKLATELATVAKRLLAMAQALSGDVENPAAPKATENAPCLQCGLVKPEPYRRGLCMADYQSTRRRIANGDIKEEEVVAAGLMEAELSKGGRKRITADPVGELIRKRKESMEQQVSAALSGVEQAEAKVIARRKKSAKKAAKKTGVT